MILIFYNIYLNKYSHFLKGLIRNSIKILKMRVLKSISIVNGIVKKNIYKNYSCIHKVKRNFSLEAVTPVVDLPLNRERWKVANEKRDYVRFLRHGQKRDRHFFGQAGAKGFLKIFPRYAFRPLCRLFPPCPPWYVLPNFNASTLFSMLWRMQPLLSTQIISELVVPDGLVE